MYIIRETSPNKPQVVEEAIEELVVVSTVISYYILEAQQYAEDI